MAGPNDNHDIIDIREDGQLPPLGPAIREGLNTHGPNGYRSLPSLLLWDEQGLKYFEDITYNPSYYLTNTEIALLEAHSHAIAQSIQPGAILLELGSGCLRKIKILLTAIDALGKDVDYYALDLDHNELARTLHDLGPTAFQHIRCHGLLGTYDDGRAWLSRPENRTRPKCVLSLGSTIGSFTRSEAADFCRQWSTTLRQNNQVGDDHSVTEAQIIIGLDACKKHDRVFGAYNDPQGANKRFLLNVLDHANRQLGIQAFHTANWTVRGEWDAVAGRHNQYLVPLEDTTFEDVRLKRGEKVFVVHSHKYDEVEKGRLWEDAEMTEVRRFMNDDETYGE